MLKWLNYKACDDNNKITGLPEYVEVGFYVNPAWPGAFIFQGFHF